MILYIDTSLNEKMLICLFEKKGKNYDIIFKKQISAFRQQSEKLIPSILKILETNNLSLKDLELISVNNEGGSFTSLRIGVVTANALAYGFNIKVRAAYIEDDKLIIKKGETIKFSKGLIVKPKYSAEPNIS